jgi:hypothetical protein
VHLEHRVDDVGNDDALDLPELLEDPLELGVAVATLPKNPGLSRIITRTVFTSLSIPFSICTAPS